jgi:hypothetical protein
MKTIYVILILIFLSCNQAKQSNDKILNNKTPESSFNIDSDTLNNLSETNLKNEYKYFFETKNNLQILRFNILDENRIEFDLSVNLNKKSSSKVQIANGIAILKKTIDGETISDEEGNGYFVEEFEFRMDSCTLVLRIDTEDFEVAKVLIRDCLKNSNTELRNINNLDIMFSKK